MNNKQAKALAITTLGVCTAIATLPIMGAAVITGGLAYMTWGFIGGMSLAIVAKKEGK